MNSHSNDHSMHPWASLFQADHLAPYQYLETFQRKTLLMPEQSLLFAVLQDAIVTFQEKMLRLDAKSKTQVREVEDWIWGSDGDGVFSFEYACMEFNISPSFLRRELLRWKHHAMAMQSGMSAQCHQLDNKRGKRRHQRSVNPHERQLPGNPS